MQRALSLYDTTIGKKAVMAASGVILLGFTVGHLAGNLNVFVGAQAFNEYSVFLRTLPAVVWGTRFLLLFSFAAHIYSAFSLWSRNKAAQGNHSGRYKQSNKSETDYAAKTMYWTGPIFLFYFIFHLAHLTFGYDVQGAEGGLFGIEGYRFDPQNPYNNLVFGFQHLGVVIPYVIGVSCLGMHLFHGIYSMFQSMGLNHTKYNALRRDLSIGLATLLALGFLSIPIAVQLGKLQPSTEKFYAPELEPSSLFGSSDTTPETAGEES